VDFALVRRRRAGPLAKEANTVKFTGPKLILLLLISAFLPTLHSLAHKEANDP
jgi:hypothetical protein